MQPEGSLPRSQAPATLSWNRSIRSITPSRFLDIRFHIFFSSTSRFSSGFFLLGFPIFPLPYACYMPRPFDSSWFYHSNNIWWWEHFLFIYYSPLSSYLVPLTLKFLPQHSVLEILSLLSSLSAEDQVSLPYIPTGKIIIIIYLSWSSATCWPVPVSRIQKSLQGSTMIPSASWGVVFHYPG